MTKYFHNAMIKLKSQLKQVIYISTAILFSFVSCEKEPDELGLGVLPIQDNLLVKHDSTSSTIFASTVKLESILSYYPDTAFKIYNKIIVGDYNDSFAGRTKSAILANFQPDSTNYNFGDITKTVADSLIFFFKIDSIFGNKNQDIEISFWELNKSIPYYNLYNSNLDETTYKGAPIFSKIFKYTNDSLTVRIDNPDFAKKLLSIPPSAERNLVGYRQFEELFKGLYIEMRSVSEPGLMAFVDPVKFTKLRLYYTNETRDTSINYYINTKVNKFTHDYTSSPIETDLQNTEPGQKVTYVQGLGGLATRISIPSLSKWAEEAPVSINKAELIIPVDQTNLAGLPESEYPKRLSIKAVGPDEIHYLIEYGFGQTFIGGVYNSNLKAYTFNLSKHLQKIANSKFLGSRVENTDLIIMADGYRPGQPNSFNKVALDFGPGKGAKLKIIYSKQ
jgi:hypothetical protein